MRIKLKRTLVTICILSIAVTSVLNLLSHLRSTAVTSLTVDQETYKRVVSAWQRVWPDPHLSWDEQNQTRFMKMVTNSTIKYHISRPQSNIWPSPDDKWDDRILNQLYHVPKHYNSSTPMKYILISDKKKQGRHCFVDQECPVSRCEYTTNPADIKTADAVVLKGAAIPTGIRPSPKQVWVYYQLESPNNVGALSHLNGLVNWTATYRSDSTIVTPYEKFVPHSNMSDMKPTQNYAAKKDKLVAWFVSHCNTPNNRLAFAKQLQKYIPVDIYGMCGDKKCPRSNHQCFDMLKEYKFYLAFENSNCEYYITEKLFANAFLHQVVPVVLGARKKDYLRATPPHSVIYAGDFSDPQELAAYLLKLDKDHTEYNKYLAWRGRGEFINTKFSCRLCALLHSLDAEPHTSVFKDLHGWWAGTSGHKACQVKNWISE